jgi:DNA primase
LSSVSRDEVVESVRQRTDMVELVGRYVNLKKAGSNFVGLCPFHSEKTPSFTVSPRKGFFHCFGCKASGDAFGFLMKMEGKNFVEALEELAHRAGIELPRRTGDSGRSRELTARLFAVNEASAEFYERILWDKEKGAKGRAVLSERKVDEATARRFRIGYAPSGWHSLAEHLKKLDPTLSDSLNLGLVVQGSRGPYDLFRDRLVFPILGLDGKVRGFGARRMDPNDNGPKYINSRQSQVFDKSELLFGMVQGRSHIQSNGLSVVVEGYFDVLTPASAGVEGLVATCGTALSAGHARLLRRMGERVVTLYDADPAGLKGSFRATEMLFLEGLSPHMVSLPEGEDPDSFVRAKGGKALGELLENSKPAIEVLAEAALQQAGENLEARTQGLRDLVPLLAACKDSLLLGNYLRLLSDRFGIDESHFRDAVQKAKQGAVVAKQPSILVEEPANKTRVDPIVAEEETCVALLARFPKLSPVIAESRVEECFGSKTLRRLLLDLIQSDPPPSAAALLSEMEDLGLRSRLFEQIMNEAAFPEEKAAESLGGCIRKIKATKLRHLEEELRNRILDAERKGQQEEARQLKAQKLKIARERNALGLAVRVSSRSHG